MSSVIAFFSQRRKTIAYAIGVGLTYASMYYGSNHYVTLAVAIAGLLGVHSIPNDDKLIQEILQKPSAPPHALNAGLVPSGNNPVPAGSWSAGVGGAGAAAAPVSGSSVVSLPGGSGGGGKSW